MAGQHAACIPALAKAVPQQLNRNTDQLTMIDVWNCVHEVQKYAQYPYIYLTRADTSTVTWDSKVTATLTYTCTL